MEISDAETEPRSRYYTEDVALFVEKALSMRSKDQRARWAHLPKLIRAYPFPFFYVAPSTRIVDLVERGLEHECAA